jgi:hypothetical protein
MWTLMNAENADFSFLLISVNQRFSASRFVNPSSCLLFAAALQDDIDDQPSNEQNGDLYAWTHQG